MDADFVEEWLFGRMRALRAFIDTVIPIGMHQGSIGRVWMLCFGEEAGGFFRQQAVCTSLYLNCSLLHLDTHNISV